MDMKTILLLFLVGAAGFSYSAINKKEVKDDTTVFYQEGIYEYDLFLSQHSTFDFGTLHSNSNISKLIITLHNDLNETLFIQKIENKAEVVIWRFKEPIELLPNGTLQLFADFDLETYTTFQNMMVIYFKKNRSQKSFRLTTNGNLQKGNATIINVSPPEIIDVEVVVIGCGFVEDTTNGVYDFPEQEAQFPGGQDSLLAYINKNLRYPQTAIDNAIQGVVYLRFIINTDGSITEIEVLKGVESEMDAEAVRVVREMPKWIPAKNRGKAVRTRYTLPVRFMLG